MKYKPVVYSGIFTFFAAILTLLGLGLHIDYYADCFNIEDVTGFWTLFTACVVILFALGNLWFYLLFWCLAKKPKTRRHKIIRGGLFAVGISTLVVGVLLGFNIWNNLSPMWRLGRYFQAMPDADMRQWIARAETLFADKKAQIIYDGLPKGVKKPHDFSNGDHVSFMWDAGIFGAYIWVWRLPEGGHKVVTLGMWRVKTTVVNDETE